MFIGEYQHSIDIKKRLAIPAKFRKGLDEKAVITKGIEKCLVIYPVNEWEDIAAKMGNLPLSQKEARSFGRMLLAGASEIDFDKLGRALIPSYLKEYAGLEKDVTVIGLHNRIEVWDTKTWNDYKNGMEPQMSDMVEKLKDLGI